MSRLPLPTSSSNVIECPTDIVLYMDQWQEYPSSAEDLHRATRQDPLFVQIIVCLQSGNWSKSLTLELAPNHRRAIDLSVVNSLLMWAQCAIVPVKLRDCVKIELHEGHFGSQHKKALTRSYMCAWWPNLKADLKLRQEAVHYSTLKHCQKLLYTHGQSLLDHGLVCTLTMQDLSTAGCF